MVRRVMVALYLGVALLAFVEPRTPRLFWTVLMPLLPLSLVLLGFHGWRRICPIAALGGSTRRGMRMPRWLERHALTASVAALYLCLVLRLLVTNGDGPALGAFLLGLAAAAALVNRLAGGKSWCNYLCPVGAVERIYTDTGSLALARAGSRCEPCTGCKRACPDIDQDRAHRALPERDRRIAFHAFPGLVLGFYCYYGLRAGDWEAFFDGRWTAAGAEPFGPGLWFAPWLPAAAAAPLTLLAFSAASMAVFGTVQRRLGSASAPFAAFCAFNLFYFFAGAPSLALVAGASELRAFVVPAIAVVPLVRSFVRGRREGAQPFSAGNGAQAASSRWPTTCNARPRGRRVLLPLLTGGTRDA